MKTTPNTNIKRFLIAASVALAIPLSAAAYGGHGGHSGDGSHAGCSMEALGGAGHHMMGGNMMPPHLRALNLTEVQQDKVFEIMHAQAPVMRDKAKARGLADEAAKAMSEMTLARANADRQVFEVMTPEQRKQLAEMKPTEHRRHGRGDGLRGAAADGAKPAGR